MFLFSCLFFRVLFIKILSKHMERYVVLPFSIGGCASLSSISVIENHSKKSKTDQDPSATRAGEGGDGLSGVKMKNSVGFLSMPKPNISNGIHRFIKSFKSFSHLFVYKEEKEEMEIGFPTDVIHVSHIGWDGSTTTTTTTKTATTNPSKGWEMLKAPELLSMPYISFKQFELAMAAQAHAHTPPSPPPPPSLVNNNGSSSNPS